MPVHRHHAAIVLGHPSVNVLVAIVIAAGVMSACKAKEQPTKAADAGAGVEDGAAAPPGVLDRTKLGAPCANSDDCDDGNCFEFGSVEPPVDGGRCVNVANGCEVVTCASGFACRATGGDPSGIDCVQQ